MTKQRRLVIVSNRLPFTVKERNKKLQYSPSVGGLATGLSAFLKSLGSAHPTIKEHLWVGWPGRTIRDALKKNVRKESLTRFHASPVFLTEEEMELFYLGFCNETIWPLFHYFPSLTVYREEYWDQYEKVNAIFAEEVLKIVRSDDVVWIHDYQLMLLPGLLKKKAPHIPLGFFLHIPFPSFEIFRLLPGTWRRRILEGLMGSDLVGFHTYEYTRHFLNCVLRILGVDHEMGRVLLGNRIVKVETFPMGIDVDQFRSAVESVDVQREREALLGSLGGRKVILSVDRLDYTKGILNRLEGFERFLDKHRQYRGKVVLLAVVVPSRLGVKQYDRMKKQIEELVGRINGKFGTVRWTPIVYQYRAVPFHPLVALYTVSDVALVTPLRDGMNLIAKEYVASRSDDSGVLILSEMAGAAKELGEAVLINPNDINEIADAMKQALEMPLKEKVRRNRIMRARIRRYDVVRWASDFVGQLLSTETTQQSLHAKLLTSEGLSALLQAYQRASSRAIFLDYDGTLAPFVLHPEDAAPSSETVAILRELVKDAANKVTIISGRNKETLEQWLGSLPLRLIAEHGIWIRERGAEWSMFKSLDNSWKPRILPILESYTDRLPGSFVEEKEFSLVWHYRGADPEHGETLAHELMDNLLGFTGNIDVHVMRGNKIIEVRSAGVTKGTVGQQLLAGGNHDFVLVVGDDWTDEDLFKVVPESAYSIKVGVGNTHARFTVQGVQDVLRLLRSLVNRSTTQAAKHTSKRSM